MTTPDLPPNLPPLPPVPEGYSSWTQPEFAPLRAETINGRMLAVFHHTGRCPSWLIVNQGAIGGLIPHPVVIAEAVRDPAKPSAQLFATPDPENVEESDDPADDHKDCRDGCRYSYEVGDGRQRVCPYGECQRNGETAKDRPAPCLECIEGYIQETGFDFCEKCNPDQLPPPPAEGGAK